MTSAQSGGYPPHVAANPHFVPPMAGFPHFVAQPHRNLHPDPATNHRDPATEHLKEAP